MMKTDFKRLISLLVFSIVIIWLLTVGHGPLPPLAQFLDPSTGVWQVSHQAYHPKHQNVFHDSITAKVTVVRDQRGVPHIFAQNDKDMAFAFGYVQAQDRLWQMEVQVRLAQGRMAEIAGIQALDMDKMYRSLCLADAAQNTMDSVKDFDEFRLVEAFTQGVNVYIANIKKSELPLEYKLLNYTPEAWRPLNLFLLLKLMAWDLSGNFDDLRQGFIHKKLGDDAAYELFPKERPFEIPIIPQEAGTLLSHRVQTNTIPTPLSKSEDILLSSFNPSFDIFHLSEFFRNTNSYLKNKKVNTRNYLWPIRDQFANQLIGSNNWVVDGRKSATGHAMLANDPHLMLTLPSIWFEAHLVTPDIDVRGVSMLGAPGIIIGFNRYIAWGQTNVGADVTDLFIEEFDSDQHEKYSYKDEWLPVEKKYEIIKVKGGDDIELVVESTHHGPVITRGDQSVSVKWVGYEPSQELLSFLKLNKARCYDDFVDALRYYSCPAQNYAYADIDGNIAMWCVGKYPIRSNGDGRIPVDGTTDQFEWTGYIPFEEIPYSLNPPQHFLASTNQQPVGSEYQHYLGWQWYGAYRSRRINNLLRSNNKITFEHMQDYQCDNVSSQALSFLPYIIRVAEKDSSNSVEIKTLLDHLRDWDGSMSKELVAPRIFVTFMNYFQENTWIDEFFVLQNHRRWPDNTILEQLVHGDPESHWFNDLRTPKREVRDDIILRSLQETYAHLSEWFGDESSVWKWGNTNHVNIGHLSALHAFGFPPIPADGSWETLNVCGDLKNTHGPSWRMVVELAKDGRRVGVYPGGQSGNPVSPHFDDGVVPWANYRYFELTMPRSPEEMRDDDIESILVFTPRRKS